MSSGALYRKYRSRSFDDVVGQEHITTTLVNSIKNETFSHAYLLTGPRGVGKTSVARLFAYMVNGIDYSDDKTYSDIIEIDAASNRRIDEIRELREKIGITPSLLKYKVYIIDEVHMLTREAFNALLKTLEEPPQHAIFILATTDFHKVPDTIASRCVRFAFSTIRPEAIAEHLKKIAKKESIDIEDSALEIIAENSEGSFRDGISLLDQFRNSKKTITAGYVARVLGISPAKEIGALIKHVESSAAKDMMDSLDKLRHSGATDSQIAKQLIAYLRSCLLDETGSTLDRQSLLKLIDSLLKINEYSNTRIALEIALFSAFPATEEKPAVVNKAKPRQEKEKDVKEENPPEPVRESSTTRPADGDFWESVLSELKNENNSLYAIARMAEVKITGTTLELYFKFPFHYKQVSNEKNLRLIVQKVKSDNGKIKEVKLFIKEKAGKNGEEPKETVKNISNIFGPSEVLES